MDSFGTSGAIPRSDIRRMDKHAESYYAEIRKRKSDITTIAKNTGFDKSDVSKIKQHIFYNKYDLGEEEPRQFDPSYDMAVSWQRLIDGKNIQDMDMVLLNHELMEYVLMNEQHLTYKEAHSMAAKIYNYQAFIDELDRKAGMK